MSKAARKSYVVAFGIATALFFGTSFIQIHRDPAFTCDHFGGKGSQTEYRLEYGLPLAYIKRSVSDFECVLKGQDYSKAPSSVGEAAAETFEQTYNKHEISYLNFIVDLYIWLTLAYFTVKIADRQQRFR